MKHVLIALALVSAPAFANSKNDLARVARSYQACLDKADSNYAMKECTGNAYALADKILQRSYDGIVAGLKKRTGEEWQDRNNVETLNRLVASERAWITFRDAECDLQGTSMLGGTGESLVVMGCLYDETVKRVNAIEKLLAP